MFDRVTISAADRAASERFYDTVLATIGIGRTQGDERGAAWDVFALAQADGPPTRGVHVGFAAPSRELVEEFWRIGTAAGYRDDGRPGARPQYRDDYYGAFLLDPDGNSIEAVQHGGMRAGCVIDHIWLRVADVPTAERFYAALAPRAGFHLAGRADDPERTRFAGAAGSLSLVAGEPAQRLRLAFPGEGEPEALVDPDGNAVELVERA